MIPSDGSEHVEGSDASAPKAGAGPDAYRVTELERGSSGHFYVDADVEGHTIKFLVDTGATLVALGPEHARRIGMDVDPSEFEPIARTASGIARGKEVHFDFIEIEGKRVSHVRGMIIEGLDVPLLGQSYLARITAVQMNGDSMILR
jgi:aspartyl protease family protein